MRGFSSPRMAFSCRAGECNSDPAAFFSDTLSMNRQIPVTLTIRDRERTSR